MTQAPQIFKDGRNSDHSSEDKKVENLYQEIGQLQVELNWLKKRPDLSIKMKRQLIDSVNTIIPISVQCRLLELSRSSYYYRPQPESELNLHLMDLIDRQYTKRPFYGARQMTKYLRRQGYRVNHKRIERLMRNMGIMAIYPKPYTSVKDEGHKVYPYLLRDLPIVYPDQVCAKGIPAVLKVK